MKSREEHKNPLCLAISCAMTEIIRRHANACQPTPTDVVSSPDWLDVGAPVKSDNGHLAQQTTNSKDWIHNETDDDMTTVWVQLYIKERPVDMRFRLKIF
jgi:hypothetical protein